jgi:hypothetical protein
VDFFLPKWKIYLEIQWQSRERFFEIYLEMTKKSRDFESRDDQNKLETKIISDLEY